MRSVLIPRFGFGRELDEVFSSMFASPAISHWLPSVESYAKDGKLEIRVDLPGVDPKEVEISLDGGQLVIRGERKSEREEENGYRQLRAAFHGAARHRRREGSCPLRERRARAVAGASRGGQAEAHHGSDRAGREREEGGLTEQSSRRRFRSRAGGASPSALFLPARDSGHGGFVTTFI
jgi:hypothetical protein